MSGGRCIYTLKIKHFTEFFIETQKGVFKSTLDKNAF